jgi:hypothetical protein
VRRTVEEEAVAQEAPPADLSELYELVVDAVRAASDDGPVKPLSRRMVGGTVIFRDAEGRTVKEADAAAFFKKVTSVREKLRVLEQKLNNHDALDTADKAELQAYITKCYGSLTTFNFLFRDDDDRFKGSGG